MSTLEAYINIWIRKESYKFAPDELNIGILEGSSKSAIRLDRSPLGEGEITGFDRDAEFDWVGGKLIGIECEEDELLAEISTVDVGSSISFESLAGLEAGSEKAAIAFVFEIVGGFQPGRLPILI